MQQLQALWLQSSRPEARPGHIAARPAEIGNETTFNRIAAAAGLSVASMSGRVIFAASTHSPPMRHVRFALIALDCLRRLGSHFEEIRDCNPIQDAFRAL